MFLESDFKFCFIFLLMFWKIDRILMYIPHTVRICIYIAVLLINIQVHNFDL
jgi:hypothetical protein